MQYIRLVIRRFTVKSIPFLNRLSFIVFDETEKTLVTTTKRRRNGMDRDPLIKNQRKQDIQSELFIFY